jgi:hypothetical protein
VVFRATMRLRVDCRSNAKSVVAPGSRSNWRAWDNGMPSAQQQIKACGPPCVDRTRLPTNRSRADLRQSITRCAASEASSPSGNSRSRKPCSSCIGTRSVCERISPVWADLRVGELKITVGWRFRIVLEHFPISLHHIRRRRSSSGILGGRRSG